MARPIRQLPRPLHSRALRAPSPVPVPTPSHEKGEEDPDVFRVNKVDRSRDGKPAVGKTTALGKKTERPDEGRPAGPSGQKERAQHNRRHANK